MSKTVRNPIGKTAAGTWFVQLSNGVRSLCQSYGQASALKEQLSKCDDDCMLIAVHYTVHNVDKRNAITGETTLSKEYTVSITINRWPKRMKASPEGKCWTSKTGFQLRACTAPQLCADAMYGPGAGAPDDQLYVLNPDRMIRHFSNKRAAKAYTKRLVQAVQEYNNAYHSK